MPPIRLAQACARSPWAWYARMGLEATVAGLASPGSSRPGSGMDSAEIDSTEKNAIEALTKVAGAVEAYRNKYLHLPNLWRIWGRPPRRGDGESAGLVDSDLANGMKNGYTIRYVILGASTLGAPQSTKWRQLHCSMAYRTSFFLSRFECGLHAADRRGAVGSETDPKLD